jgi:hypothetical protein
MDNKKCGKPAKKRKTKNGKKKKPIDDAAAEPELRMRRKHLLNL